MQIHPIKSLNIMMINYTNLKNKKVTRMNIPLNEGIKDNEYAFNYNEIAHIVGMHAEQWNLSMSDINILI